ncbi:efflux RND transporter periplasmic adaptor subunit [Planctomycetales bacterium ZRK34]|nr:efflux RND transporter periplasmic adaptor subunit [Planctomycetales bacterium ZRK34]
MFATTRNLFAVLWFGLIASQLLAQGAPPAAVRIGEIKKLSVIEKRLVTGQIEPSRRTIVAAEESGRVTVGPAEPGTTVKQGEVVAQIDDALLKVNEQIAEAQIHEAQADVDQMQAQLATASRSRKRLEQLVASDVARQKELDDSRDSESVAQARLSLAQAALERARGNLQALKIQLDKTRVIAPFDAYITRKSTEVGQWVSPGDPVVELVETVRVKVKLNVPQFMVDVVPMDEAVDLKIDAVEAVRQAKVFSIVPDGDPQARTFRVLFKLDNPDGMIKPGMSASAQLPTGKTIDALTTPRDAVITTKTGSLVYAVRGGVAVAVPVIVRFGQGDRFVVDADLTPGDQVVIEGNERLFPGQPVNVLNAGGEN